MIAHSCDFTGPEFGYTYNRTQLIQNTRRGFSTATGMAIPRASGFIPPAKGFKSARPYISPKPFGLVNPGGWIKRNDFSSSLAIGL